MTKRQHYLYGVFTGTSRETARWSLYRNGQIARRVARHLAGELRRMPLPDTRTWDAPTFYQCSEPVSYRRR